MDTIELAMLALVFRRFFGLNDGLDPSWGSRGLQNMAAAVAMTSLGIVELRGMVWCGAALCGVMRCGATL